MSRRSRSAVGFALGILVLLCAGTAGWAGAEYRVGVVPHTKPFQYMENDRIMGSHVEILDQIGKNKYISFTYVVFDTQTQAYGAMERGEIDLILGVCTDQKPPGGVLLSSSINQDSVGMLTRQPISLDEHQDLSCVIPQDVFDNQGFVPLANISYWIYPSIDSACAWFTDNPVDLLMGPRGALNQYRADNPSQRCILSDTYITTITYGIALPAASKPFLQLINNEILQLKLSGELDRIQKQWVIAETVPQKTLNRFVLGAAAIVTAALFILRIVVRLNKYLKQTVEEQTAKLKQANLHLEEQIIKVRNVNELRDCLIQNNNRAIIVFNEQDRITIFNDRAMQMSELHISPIGMNVWELDLVRQLIGEKRDTLFAEDCGPFEMEKTVTDALGNSKTYQCDLFPLYTPDNGVRAINLMISDITEENRLRDEVYERQKSIALNRIIAGMAHELRNPMTTIKTFVELVPTKKDDEEFQQQLVKIVPGEIERIDNLLTNLIEYAKPSNFDKEACEIVGTVKSIVELMQHIAQRNGMQLLYCAGQPCFVRLSIAQLKQIMINLILNAIDATAEKGGEQKEIEVRTVSNKEFAYITVRDHGVGMTGEEVKNAIEPFYSTKWNGTGLGLYIVKQYIEQNGGRLIIDSKYAEGTRMVIKFPLAPSE